MQLTNTRTRYGAIPQLIHWLTALCVTVGWSLGQFGDDLPSGEAREFGLLTHMTLGECVFALLIARMAWRFVNPPPRPEATPFGGLVEAAAKLSHFTLYVLLLVVPVLGVIVQLKRGHALPVFGFWHFVPPWPAERGIARSVLLFHQYLANALLILAGLHACAALLHHWLWRDQTLRRMLPGAASV